MMRAQQAVERRVPRDDRFDRLGLARQVNVDGRATPRRLGPGTRRQQKAAGQQEAPRSRPDAGSLPDHDAE
jgi:hypothetical protein